MTTKPALLQKTLKKVLHRDEDKCIPKIQERIISLAEIINK
jgi:hypothetical protein